MGIYGLRLGEGVEVGTGITISSQYEPPMGTAKVWTNGSFFDLGTAQSGITTSTVQYAAKNANTAWQLCYAWQTIQLYPAQNTFGYNAWGAENTGWSQWSAVSSTEGTIGNWVQNPNYVYVGSAGQQSTAGSFQSWQPPNSSTWFPAAVITIPAGRYFLVGITGPRYATFQSATLNKTAYVGAVPYFTVLNTVFINNTASYTPTIPSQLGGTDTSYTQYNNTTWVASFAFAY